MRSRSAYRSEPPAAVGTPLVVLWYQLVLAVGLALLASPSLGWGATPQQRREATALYNRSLKAAGLYKRGNYSESGKVISEVQQRLAEMARGGDETILRLLEPIHRRLVKAHALLELEGVELAPIAPLRPPRPTPSSSPDEISFTRDIAAILVTRCGRCHVNAQRGEFSLASYEELMRGSTAGAVIFAGDASGSRLIEVIESGDMPRGGGKVPEQELAALKAWITRGAEFDGDEAGTRITEFVEGASPADGFSSSAARPTGGETVSFALEIAPLLAERCSGCHVNGQRARAGLDMSTFAGLIRGGDSGPPIRPRSPSESLLIQRIKKGEGGGPRMPLDRPPLSDEATAKIEQWIAEGAAFDGIDTDQNLVRVAALAKARHSSHEALSAERAQLAEQNWRLGMGRILFDRVESKHFLLLGNVGEETLKEVGRRADAVAPVVARSLGASAEDPLVKGRVTLFVFNQRYDYSEFGQMVERRELPKEWRGHWRFDVVDAYGALLPPRADEYDLDALIGQQLAGTYVASLGNSPDWFREGTARVVAARLAPKDPRVAAWNDALRGVLATSGRPDDFLNGELPAEDADVASYSFVRFLMNDARRFPALLAALKNGQPFDKSFALIYGAPPSRVTQAWARNVLRK